MLFSIILFWVFGGFTVCLIISVLLIGLARKKEGKEESERKAAIEKKKIEDGKRAIEEFLREIDELKISSPEEYYAIKLGAEMFFMYADTCCKDSRPSEPFNPSVTGVLNNRILGIDCNLPGRGSVSQVKEVYSLKNGDKRTRLLSERDFMKVYENALYTLCLKSVKYLFDLDSEKDFDYILFNGYVYGYNPSNGQEERRLILSLYVRREQFSGIDLEHVEPKTCFKHLKGVSAAKLIDAVPVIPVLTFNKEDSRFVESKDIQVNSGTNLAAIGWEDFEHLVRELFEAEFSSDGGEVKVTQASRDGGVDAVVFDPDPIRGGKIIVQAKRYTNTVPVSAVRDLYGTIINEGANSGILITTSNYGRDSFDFASGKPIKLLNGENLLGLLQKHGHEAYIDIQEAKRLNTTS